MTQSNNITDRRSALKVLATSLAVSNAGCLGIFGESDTPSPDAIGKTNGQATTTAIPPTQTPASTKTPSPKPSTTRTQTTELKLPDYRKWLFATGLMKTGLPIRVTTVALNEFSDYFIEISEEGYRIVINQFKEGLTTTVASHDLVHRAIRLRNAYVFLGDFERNERNIDRNLTENEGFTRKTPEYRGFLRYVDEENGRAAAVSEGIVVVSTDPPSSGSPLEMITQIIDTGFGGGERLFTQRPNLKPLAATLGERTHTLFTRHEPGSRGIPGKIAHGIAYDVGGDMLKARYLLQFQDPSQATDDAIDSWFDTYFPYIKDWQDRSRAIKDGLVLIDGKVPYDSMLVEK